MLKVLVVNDMYIQYLAPFYLSQAVYPRKLKDAYDRTTYSWGRSNAATVARTASGYVGIKDTSRILFKILIF